MSARPPSRRATSGTLVVTIEGFRSAVGHARVAVFNRGAGFPDDESTAYRKVVTDIGHGNVEVRFDDLPLADYAVSMYHDENDDAKLNKGLFGVPKGRLRGLEQRDPRNAGASVRGSPLSVRHRIADRRYQSSLLNGERAW